MHHEPPFIEFAEDRLTRSSFLLSNGFLLFLSSITVDFKKWCRSAFHNYGPVYVADKY